MADIDPLAVRQPVAVEQLAVRPKVDYWTLQKINKAVNRSRHSDGSPIMANGKPLTLRDCEWFTHFKRQEMIDRYQANKDDLQNVYVATENQQADEPNHVVLRMGDWILDNRFPNPYKYEAMLKKYREYPGWSTLKGRK